MRPLRQLSLGFVLVTQLVFGSGSARADDSSDSPLAYGLLATELSMAGVFALNFGVDGWPNQGPALALNMAPLVLGPAAGFGAHVGDLDPRPAYAVHGAAIIGMDLFMVGMLIDGRNHKDGLDVGIWAWSLGALGVAAGGWIGAQEIDNADEGVAFYAAPAGGLVVGGLVGILAAVIRQDSNNAMEHVVWGASGGLTLGIAASLAYSLSDFEGTRESEARAIPGVRASADRLMFSYGGFF